MCIMCRYVEELCDVDILFWYVSRLFNKGSKILPWRTPFKQLLFIYMFITKVEVSGYWFLSKYINDFRS